MTDLLMGTVKSLDPIAIAADGSTTAMPVSFFVPANLPSVGDRVLYQLIGGQAAVLANITRPTRMWSTLLTMGGAANTADLQAVPFPSGWFTATPTVVGTLGTGNSDPSTINTEIDATGVSASGFNAVFIRSNATTCAVRWLAVQL